MKKIILLTIAMVMSLSVVEASAAAKEKKRVEKTIFVTDIDCEHCVQKVMNYMPYQKGIKDVNVDLAKKQVTVSYDLKKTNEGKVVEAFSKIDVAAKKFDPKAVPTKAHTSHSHEHHTH